MNNPYFIQTAIKAVEEVFSDPDVQQIKFAYTHGGDTYCWLGAVCRGLDIHHSELYAELGYTLFTRIAGWNDIDGYSWQKINELLKETIENE